MGIKDENNFDNIKPITFLKKEKVMPTWYYQIQEWWIVSKIIDVKYYIQGIFSKLVRMWNYAQFSASNLDFDYAYLIDILEFKLMRMKKEFKDSCLDNNDIIKEISYVLDLIKSYKENNFVSLERENHKKKFGELKDEWKKLPNGDYEWLMHYEKDGVLHRNGSEHVEKAHESSGEIYKLNEKLRKECLHKIMYYMAENMEKWWD